MAFLRIYKIAEALNMTSQEVMFMLKKRRGIDARSASSTVDEAVARSFIGEVAHERQVVPPNSSETKSSSKAGTTRGVGMAGTLILLGGKSVCHRVEMIIVKSRSGGFVTQNCQECGQPYALSKWDLPELACQRCGTVLEATTNSKKNYAYSCPECGHAFALAHLVPHWTNLFTWKGFGLDSDLPKPVTPLAPNVIEGILANVLKSKKE